MARYLYYCSACNRKYELEKSMTQAQIPEPCPECGKIGVRVFTPPGLKTKGTRINCGETTAEDPCAGCQDNQCGGFDPS